MRYVGTELEKIITVNKIFSIHYFEYMSDFDFSGETHDFWELLYVDRGEVEVTAGDNIFSASRGEIIFHKPDEFHALRANGIVAPNLVVVSFECLSKAMLFFENQRLNVSGSDKKCLSQIISEAKKSFSSPLDKTYLAQLERREKSILGGEQLIGIYLEQLLISLLRRYSTVDKNSNKISRMGEVMTKENYEEIIYKRVIDYMNEHIKESLPLSDICKEILVSRSKLQNLFNKKHQCGVIQYFNSLKIEESKRLMREGHMNFTGIADYLGYASIHYFSRQFKKITNMTPSEYVSSVKGLSEYDHLM